MDAVLIGVVVVVVTVLVAIILQLEFELWLSRRDVRTLRQVPLVAPDQRIDGGGGTVAALGLLLLVIGAVMLRVLA
jgi:hypothetical protein